MGNFAIDSTGAGRRAAQPTRVLNTSAIKKPDFMYLYLYVCLTNERDFPVPSEPRTVRLAVYGN